MRHDIVICDFLMNRSLESYPTRPAKAQNLKVRYKYIHL